MLAVLACSFVFWLLASQTGTRLLLTTAAQQLDGQALDVRGSILRGLEVGRLDLDVGGTRIGISDLRLTVRWRALGDRLLHVRELAAGSVEVALATGGETPADAGSDEPFALPSLPVAIAVDRLALGEFHLLQDGEPLPVELGDLSATFAAGRQGAQLRIANLRVGHEVGQAQVSGQAEVQALADPWPFTARLDVIARGSGPDSPLCQADQLSGKFAPLAQAQASKAPETAKSRAGAGKAKAGAAKASAEPVQSKDAGAFVGPPAPACQVVLRADAAGSMESIQAKLDGNGAGLALDVMADLAPRTPLVLRSARADARLPDKSTLSARLDLQAVDGQPGRDRIVGSLGAQRLNLSPWLGDAVPPAVLSANAQLSAEFENLSRLRQAAIDLRFEDGTRWNKQALAGMVQAQVEVAAPAANPPAGADAAAAANAATAELLAGLRIHGLDVDLKLGPNRVRAQGEIGGADGALTLDAQAPQLDAFWPGVPGGADVKGKLGGTVASHRGEISAGYNPPKPRPGVLGQSRAEAAITFAGGWGKGPAGEADAALTGWRGTLSRLTAGSAGFTVSADRPVTLSYLPAAVAPQWQWQVGPTVLGVALPGKEKLAIAHKGSRGDAKRWETAGQADNLVITAAMARQVIAAVDPDAAAKMKQGPKRVNATVAESQRRIALDASWDLKFDGRLAGRARIARRDGDLLIPGDPPVPLGVKALVLDLTATPTGPNASRLDARLDLATDKMGKIAGNGTAVLAVDAKGGMALDPRQPIRARLDADIADLAWVGLFVGDSMEIGGQVKANLEAQGTLAGKWSASGAIRGDKLRVVRIDDGVRLIDGTLAARLDGDKLVLDSLRFPASLRVMPAEWRTKEWITTNPEAKGGYAEAKGQWNLIDGGGNVRLTLYRFPALQRSDRYAMVSGTIDLNAAMPRIDIVGDLKADAGWFSLEILQGVPSLDDDVKVRRAGDDPGAVSTPLQTSMNLKFDMGPRFYITGMGLDAGLLGSIQILLNDGRLTGVGALRTRGGGIEAYGQKLRLRRGTLTFQGRLDNPLLDIEALRTGEQVEAGVKVVGTAQRPRIDLVSYPDVSDVEKLSWLLLGRGPDESGSDAALLLSVGTALLGGGEPFYKQFGLDDVSVRTGNLGSSGSILPDRTVAGDVNRDSDSQLATQFLVASKSFANGITLSVEQALAGSDTVGRASYRLARGLSLDLKGGSVNGIALVYRTFFGD
ncbi:translocation/assembly module TamB domain-containing protein [Achromobacter xylosoxidans]|nr:translocation/assembly module TamB domain-containing protein [Achromobacter xylosoxidans]QQE60616.1 translocation/assembly module TamB domain-containing protein [Achromobacter xylosoxidans]QQV17332.1 translocation/assembly module TamB domain-containing protein [Achromobacter xylosoxidans]UXL08302.1 translocation/assembly module TamB domain-containing protein [Achromobacter xylosoxidans]